MPIELPGPDEVTAPTLCAILKEGHTVKADVKADVLALIVGPDYQLFYHEAWFTSASGCNAWLALMATEETELTYFPPGVKPEFLGGHGWLALRKPERPVAVNTRLPWPTAAQVVVADPEGKKDQKGGRWCYHAAILDQGGKLILSQDMTDLWEKVRAAISTPTLPSWGKAILPWMLKSNALIPCACWGVPHGLKAHVLSVDADKKADRAVGKYVQAHGLKEADDAVA
jgi:hypothetical protein